jgi:hypothetical protein
MIRSDSKTCVHTERSSVLTCCHTDLWLHCGSHLIIIISNNLTSSSSPRKSKLSLPGGLSVCPVNCPLDLLKTLVGFPLSVFDHRSCGPASLPDHQRTILYKRTQAWWSPWLSLTFFGYCSRSPASPPDYHENHLTVSKWTQPWWSPLAFVQFHISSP